MKKIILTVGCPGSGKSTWASQYVKDNPGFLILTRDDIRQGLFGLSERNEYKYSKAKEKAVKEAQLAQAKALLDLESTKGIIVADTNLNPATVEAWYTLCYARTDCQISEHTFIVPWNTLVKRNKTRGTKAVPIEVLRNMYHKMNPEKYDPIYYRGDRPKAVIFDLDGTLAINTHRSPFDLEKCIDDAPNTRVVELFKMYRAAGYKCITVSGRESGTKDEPIKYRVMTLKWLMNNGLSPDQHWQRKQGDQRSDDIVKEEIFWSNIVSMYDVKLAVDDRDQVVEMWRRIGIDCFQVNFGEF